MLRLNLNRLENYKKKFFLIFSDFIIIIFSIFFAYSLRLEKIYSIFEIDLRIYLLFCVIYGLVFYINNIYQILIRYFDYFSIKKILKSILICTIIIIPINFYIHKLIYFPRSVSIITPFIITILMLSHRILISFLININSDKIEKKNLLIIGMNNQNIELIKNLNQNINYSVQGIIDTKNVLKKRLFNGIKIFKKTETDDVISKLNINEILLDSTSLNKKEISNLFQKYENKNLRIKIFNRDKNFLNNYLSQSIISKINFYDIINRTKITVNKKNLLKQIKSKNILVTGGGGSIGSELCLEILKHKPKKLYILDSSEINLFDILNKIKSLKFKDKKIIKFILGDCGDQFFIDSYFKKLKIDDIYHAAAYKHVNFGEENPYSMIKNNIYTTKNLVNFSIKKKVKKFVFISSDKAVNPKSILGKTKKFGEEIINYEYLKNKKINLTKFTIVRFGNVIGSSGSVIPIFLNQLKNNMPLTVTHKKATRYFMSISEAVQLVINASYLNKSNLKIFALDMGEQINIYDIAKRLIRLSGNTIQSKHNKKGDIPIKIIGLKKGEKMNEEISLGSNLLRTSHSKIMHCKEKINIKNFTLRLNTFINKFYN